MMKLSLSLLALVVLTAALVMRGVSAESKEECLLKCKAAHPTWKNWEQTGYCQPKCTASSLGSSISSWFSKTFG